MEQKQIAIIIPARYASTRFPGKPLAKIGDKSMLQRVYLNAQRASDHLPSCNILVATDDERIADHCKEHGIAFVMTSPECRTGTDRVLEAANTLSPRPDFIVNMQGDAPFTPWDFVRDVIDDYYDNPDIDVITPINQLTWEELDALREHKKTNPFSGTTAIYDGERIAHWFSKTIIPAIRNEENYRTREPLSPVNRHIGLYAYTYDALSKFVTLPESIYERLEGLEQLRFLENDMRIRIVRVKYGERPAMSGVDTPDDLKKAQDFAEQLEAS